MDFYELRHFCGSELGRMKMTAFDIGVQLGHRDGGKTAMKYYIHTPEEEAQERLRAAFENVVPLDRAARKESLS